MSRVDDLRLMLLKRESNTVIQDEFYLSSGSTLVNLACTGKALGAFLKGRYYWFCGDSNSGKTFLCLTCLAEATLNPAFDDYRLIYDGPEGGALMDIERFFGKKTKDRLEPPETDEDEEPINSSTIQEFYFHVDDALKDGRPFIYILDSMDCLSSNEEISKFDETKKAFSKGKAKDVSGSYGDGKAKINSSALRKLMGPLEKSGSILIIISQTRDSFDLFQKSTASGGRAPKFYATLRLWSSSAGKLDKVVGGKPRQLGIVSKVRVDKSRVTGKDRTVNVNIYHSVGIDDIGSCVSYLVGEGVWKKDKTSGKITATGLGPEFSGSHEKIVHTIEEKGLRQDLIDYVESVWNDIEEKCVVHRERRYE